MSSHRRRSRFAGELAQLLTQDFLLFNLQILVPEEYHTSLRDYAIISNLTRRAWAAGRNYLGLQGL